MSGGVNETQGFDSSTVARAVVTSLNLSSPNTVIEEEKRKKVSNFQTAVWISESSEIKDRKVTRAPFLRQIPVEHQLNGV